MLVCENVTCKRGGNVVFQNLGFCLPEGSLLLLKGPNGSGKTSLMDILADQLPCEEGQVKWDGEPIHGNVRFRDELMTVGHKNEVNPNLTVHENIDFWAKKHGTEMLLPAALAYFDLNSMAKKLAGELSAGWQQRVALARLIVAPCKLWLLDEPTNFLDIDAVMLVASLIETRIAQGGIVVAASQIMGSTLAAHNLDLTDFAP
jgi:heme exporter protein A